MDQEKPVASIRSATEFLESNVACDAYFLAASASDGGPCPIDGLGHVFVAWFVTRALNADIHPDTARIISERIHRERVSGVWPYGEGLPLDADDTAFALRSLRLLGQDVRWFDLLGFHSPSAGLFRTFPGHGPTAFVTAHSVAGNNAAHLEVNANVFGLLRRAGGEAFTDLDIIAGQQADNGSWTSYFYPGPFYGTLFCIESLAGSPTHKGAVQKAVRFLVDAQNGDGSWGQIADPWASALALNGLMEAFDGHRIPQGRAADAFLHGIDYLCRAQHPDGSWSTQAVIHDYRFRDEPEVIWRALDTNRVLTTALALAALKFQARG